MSGVKGTKARRVQLPVPFLVILILCASLLKRDLPSAILVVNSFASVPPSALTASLAKPGAHVSAQVCRHYLAPRSSHH